MHYAVQVRPTVSLQGSWRRYIYLPIYTSRHGRRKNVFHSARSYCGGSARHEGKTSTTKLSHVETPYSSPYNAEEIDLTC